MRIALLLTAVIAFVGFSCEKSSNKRPSQLLRLNIRGEPATLDPRKGGDLISAEMHILLFEGLTSFNSDGSISCAQAESYEISPDQLKYTFHLRDTLWSNGMPVTATDFEKAWKSILDPNFPAVNAHLLYPIQNAERAKKGEIALSAVGIAALDPKTLVVTLERPTPYFLDLTSFCLFSPICHAIDNERPHWAYEAGSDFICNGPYVLEKWDHNNLLAARKNPLYWQKEKVKTDAIHFTMVSDEMTALQMFERGELDMIGAPLCSIPPDALSQLQLQAKVIRRPMAATTLITFNTEQFPFNNVHIRKAFSYAIHRQQIVDHITQMQEQIALNAIPPILKDHQNRSFFVDGDIEQAQALFAKGLAELGIDGKAFPEVIYNYTTSDSNHKIAQEIQQQWQNAFGIRVRIENNDHKILMHRLIAHDYMAAQCIWVAQYNDQMNILERFKFKTNGKNYPNWEDARFVQLLDRSFYELGEDRMRTLEEAEALFLDQMPVAPIYHWDFVYIVQPELNNVMLSSTGDLYFSKMDLSQ